jgi:hypothetical protein
MTARRSSRRFSAVLSVAGDDAERIRALRKACKLLWRSCRVRLVELKPITDGNA